MTSFDFSLKSRRVKAPHPCPDPCLCPDSFRTKPTWTPQVSWAAHISSPQTTFVTPTMCCRCERNCKWLLITYRLKSAVYHNNKVQLVRSWRPTGGLSVACRHRTSALFPTSTLLSAVCRHGLFTGGSSSVRRMSPRPFGFTTGGPSVDKRWCPTGGKGYGTQKVGQS